MLISNFYLYPPLPGSDVVELSSRSDHYVSEAKLDFPIHGEILFPTGRPMTDPFTAMTAPDLDAWLSTIEPCLEIIQESLHVDPEARMYPVYFKRPGSGEGSFHTAFQDVVMAALSAKHEEDIKRMDSLRLAWGISLELTIETRLEDFLLSKLLQFNPRPTFKLPAAINDHLLCCAPLPSDVTNLNHAVMFPTMKAGRSFQAMSPNHFQTWFQMIGKCLGTFDLQSTRVDPETQMYPVYVQRADRTWCFRAVYVGVILRGKGARTLADLKHQFVNNISEKNFYRSFKAGLTAALDRDHHSHIEIMDSLRLEWGISLEEKLKRRIKAALVEGPLVLLGPPSSKDLKLPQGLEHYFWRTTLDFNADHAIGFPTMDKEGPFMAMSAFRFKEWLGNVDECLGAFNCRSSHIGPDVQMHPVYFQSSGGVYSIKALYVETAPRPLTHADHRRTRADLRRQFVRKLPVLIDGIFTASFVRTTSAALDGRNRSDIRIMNKLRVIWGISLGSELQARLSEYMAEDSKIPQVFQRLLR
ncbi:hypothetical protein DFH09DRAFT_1461878 [Mycena vulgaris]|nr:hypothetical protein DFH09DRAFT_1461878 [Mycena vulgaris]